MILAFLALCLSAALAAEGMPPHEVRVQSVYDGDTLTLETGHKVRLSCVNTPELKPLEPYGMDARDLTKSLVEGQVVSLVFGGKDPRDGYGRIVAGVKGPQGSLDLALVEAGLGHVFLIPPIDIDPIPLLAAQAKARAAKLGIWSTDRYAGDLHITSFHTNAPGDDRENINGEYMRIANLSDQPVDTGGYSLEDITGKRWVIPSILIPPGHTFMVHSGEGSSQADPKRQLSVHLGATEPVWNNSYERARLLDRYGNVIDVVEHKVASPTD